jgi:hypothetical protein
MSHFPFCFIPQSLISENMTQTNRTENDSLRDKLTPLQYEVTQNKGTERPFTGKHLDNKEKGTYTCIVCVMFSEISDCGIKQLFACCVSVLVLLFVSDSVSLVWAEQANVNKSITAQML